MPSTTTNGSTVERKPAEEGNAGDRVHVLAISAEGLDPDRRQAPRRRRRAPSPPRGRSRARCAAASGPSFSSTCSTSTAMSRKPIAPARKASSAASFAALNTAPASPPSASTSPGQPQRRETAPGRPARSRAGRARRSRAASTGSGRRVGPVEREADRRRACPRAELGDDRAVAEPHHGMHDRLRMHQYLDRLGVNVEERLRLDHLQRLVEHGGAVDRDALAHVPVRMRPRLRRRGASPSASRDQSRNGPPEAVRMIRSTSAGVSPRSAWKMALCSLSTGMQPGAVRGAGAAQQVAGADQALLVGERQDAAVPGEPRGSGARPAAPTIADIAQSTGSAAAASSASGPAAASMPLPASAAASSASRSASAVTATARLQRAGLLGEERDVAGTGERDDLEGLGAALPRRSATTVLLPDRAGRAEDADPAPHHQLPTRRCRGCRRSRRTRRRPSPRRAGPSPRRGRGSAGSRP